MGILGESLYSRLNPGVDREAKLAIISARPERFQGESLEGVPDSRTGLIMGDFTGNSGHEGRRAGQGAPNVRSLAFHEGRGAGKTDPLGGRDLVNRKKKVTRKENREKKDAYARSAEMRPRKTVEPFFAKVLVECEGVHDLQPMH